MLTKNLLIVATLLCSIAIATVKASCEETVVEGIIDKIKDDESSDIGKFFKNVGCSIKKEAKKFGENAKKVGESIKEGAKNFGEKTRQFGRDIRDKFGEYKEKWSPSDSMETVDEGVKLPETVEKIKNEAERVLEIDQRFLYVPLECPEGKTLDKNGDCK